MPRFSNTEKEQIREALLVQGRELFSRYGLRKTSVDDITKAVKIAKGSFYSFYESKEELFLEIFGQVNQEMQEAIYKAFTHSRKKANTRLYEALQMQYEYVDQTPIFQILMDEDEMEYLLRKYPKAGPQLQSFFADENYIPFVEELKKGGLLKKQLETTFIVGLLKAIFLIHQRKNDFKGDQFKKVFDTYLSLIVEHITPES